MLEYLDWKQWDRIVLVTYHKSVASGMLKVAV